MVKRWSLILLRNLAGWVLIVVGVLFGWLPVVQGTAMVVLGLALADWPGKRRTFRWLRTFRFFRRTDAWIHRRFGFRLPEHRDARRAPR
ncbi:hypothetical protein K2X85_03900 [bacterium]|nr:hypothetical protein [bacterium]